MAYLPATSLPAGPSPDGLPVGLQVTVPYLSDRTTTFLGGPGCRPVVVSESCVACIQTTLFLRQ
ncbi:hypothetical protein GCM10023350_22800 [Nocardioides endophyticus]|uniref:Amidase domain-containing protein n=1 Tax=Nocardioides endophyticus TaxID=1353775 RepID=A0ABP8YUD9_9ACTN